MSEELIYENLYSALELADSILQIWMSATFGVIVAFHLAGDRIGRFLYGLVIALFGLASLVLAMRYVSAAVQVYFYSGQLIKRGFEPWPVPNLVAQLIGGGTLLLIIGGTCGAIWFMHSARTRR